MRSRGCVRIGGSMAESMAAVHGSGPAGATCGICHWATTRRIDGVEETYCVLRKLWLLPSERACVAFRPLRDDAADLLASLRATVEER